MVNWKKTMMAAAGGGAGLNIEDVFSTYLYEGNGTDNRAINNGIDLSGEGGLVWIKNRDFIFDHLLGDTERGINKGIRTNSTVAENPFSDRIKTATSTGFTIGTADEINSSNTGYTGSLMGYASWTFRKAPKFFDIVTYTGTGTEQSISHSLGTDVGFIMIKRTDASGDGWPCWHRSLGNDKCIFLNSTGTAFSSTTRIRSASSTSFTVGTTNEVNASGGSYVAYLFAHNNSDGDFGPTGDQDIIKCGSYNTQATVDLGFEPQWLLFKSSNSSGTRWIMFDNMRGLGMGDADIHLRANENDEEQASQNWVDLTSTGFKITNSNAQIGDSGMIYIAIRRGPMAVPESATDVFEPTIWSSGSDPSFSSSFPVDFAFWRTLPVSTDTYSSSRLTSGNRIKLNSSSAETAQSGHVFDYMNGWMDLGELSSNYASWMWKRAPSFFDVVTYTGNGVAGRTVTHNLGAVPDMMWVRKRSQTSNWEVYLHSEGGTKRIYLDVSNAIETTSSAWNNTDATDTEFTLGTSSQTNQNGGTFVAYLFSSLAGISKIGTYTGNGTSSSSTNTIDCGFSSGARFVLCKRIDGVGNWVYFDTERGIVSGNDGYMYLNLQNANVSTVDVIDPHNSGFTLVGNYADWNANGGEYMFYAIA